VLYIGRYDWSHHWHNPHDQDFEINFQDWADTALNSKRGEMRTAADIANMEARKQLEGLSTSATKSSSDVRLTNIPSHSAPQQVAAVFVQ
jgi:hypothetical protein